MLIASCSSGDSQSDSTDTQNTPSTDLIEFEFDSVGVVNKGSTLIGVVKDGKRGSFDIKTQKLTLRD
ncbi:MAG: hypothetical protein HWE22_01600 [Flavobacteriales bacterium]|nr:hypothetical protein [Flavobacteriales bacterium]